MSRPQVKNQFADYIDQTTTAAENGSVGAQVGLGLIYEFGLGVAVDHIEAQRWFEEAADQPDPGGPIGARHLGLLHLKSGTTSGKFQALGFLQAAADDGDAIAAEVLASLDPEDIIASVQNEHFNRPDDD